MIANQYYSKFEGKTFVVQAEGDAVETTSITLAVLYGIRELLDHRIRIVLVLGEGARLAETLRIDFGARQHAETHRLVLPESALPRIEAERRERADSVARLCEEAGVGKRLLHESIVRAERRIGHGSTGVVASIQTRAVKNALDDDGFVILGLGGKDVQGRFLYVPSTSLASEVAVQLGAHKLLFLTRDGGIFVPNGKGGTLQLSFADLEELLCLLQRQGLNGEFLVTGVILPKVHACIRAVAGGVQQAHLVSHQRWLDEILTRTGAGTMIERQQSHHVDYARESDLAEIQRLHSESLRYKSQFETSYVKPRDGSELRRLLPTTLVLTHRRVILGKLHAVETPEESTTVQIGGFVIGENHQDSQQGRLLLSEALARLQERGYRRAVAITASSRAKSLFAKMADTGPSTDPVLSSLLEQAKERYARQERAQVELFQFPFG